MDRSILYNRDGSVTLREEERELVLKDEPTNVEVDKAAAEFFTPDEAPPI
jgi:hypothetical protein